MIYNINDEILKHLLDKNNINIEYQPIVSVKDRQILGVEALSRCCFNGEAINPLSLFSYAKTHPDGKTVDILCRTVSLEGAKEFCEFSLLFLNFEASLLDFYISRFPIIKQTLSSLGIAHNHVVIEINETCSKNHELLLRFIKIFRSAGFLIALDDVGAGHSNLNRLIESKPDIIKIDKQAITDINNDYYKNEATKALVNLARRIGAVTIAEGVETINEAVACMKLGIDFYQGFYFSKSQTMENLKNTDYSSKFTEIYSCYNGLIKEELNATRIKLSYYHKGFEYLVNCLCDTDEENFDSILKYAVDGYEKIESIYIIDINGLQVTDTVMSEEVKKTCNPLFSPTKKNSSHNMRPYFFTSAVFDSDIFVSDVYISIATGCYCQTNSILFKHTNGKKYVACLDFKV